MCHPSSLDLPTGSAVVATASSVASRVAALFFLESVVPPSPVDAADTPPPFSNSSLAYFFRSFAASTFSFHRSLRFSTRASFALSVLGRFSLRSASETSFFAFFFSSFFGVTGTSFFAFFVVRVSVSSPSSSSSSTPSGKCAGSSSSKSPSWSVKSSKAAVSKPESFAFFFFEAFSFPVPTAPERAPSNAFNSPPRSFMSISSSSTNPSSWAPKIKRFGSYFTVCHPATLSQSTVSRSVTSAELLVFFAVVLLAPPPLDATPPELFLAPGTSISASRGPASAAFLFARRTLLPTFDCFGFFVTPPPPRWNLPPIFFGPPPPPTSTMMTARPTHLHRARPAYLHPRR